MKQATQRSRSFLPSIVVLACLGVCAVLQATETGADETVLVGRLTRAEIEAALPDWVLAEVESEPDMEAALGLAQVDSSSEVTVYFGSWCSDSRRELARLWKALDMIGGEVDFSIRYVGVDRSKAEPAADIEGRQILYVPTFIVERDGLEVGQIVEQSPQGVELDLLALLEGRASGWISARDDLPDQEFGQGH